MPAPRRNLLHATKRGLWAATRPVIRDSRHTTVTVFDSRVRLWRDPAGLDFPQKDFRRVLDTLRGQTLRAGGPPPSPGWSINVGILGAVAIGLFAFFAGWSGITLVWLMIVWIAVWIACVGGWVNAANERRPFVDAPDFHQPKSPRHPWHEWLAVYGRLPVMLVSGGLFTFVFLNLGPRQSQTDRVICLVFVVVNWLSILYYAVSIGRKHARTFPRGASELQIARAMLTEHRCPTCAYDLRSVEADPADGCLVCPECGGAWHPTRLDAITPVFSTAANPPQPTNVAE